MLQEMGHTPRMIPPLAGQAEDVEFEATRLLNKFAVYTSYRHGKGNPTLGQLRGMGAFEKAQVVRFLNAWWSFSRRTPQILLRTASCFSERDDRALVMKNYMEEDGLYHAGDVPHYDLLVSLIEKIGGELQVCERAETLIGWYMHVVEQMTTPARATGLLSGFEHPALDITEILGMVVHKCGCAPLLTEDPYLTIHVAVEPSHIVWAHGTSLRVMGRGALERAEVIRGFQETMDFWESFWALAMGELVA